PSACVRLWSPGAPALRSWRPQQTNLRPPSALRPLHPWLRTSSLHSVTPFPVKTNSNLRVCPLLCQRRVRLGRAYSHRIPLAELKCVSPTRRLEMAARLGGELGGQRRAESPRHAYFRPLFRSGARDERRLQPSSAAGRERQTARHQAHPATLRYYRAYRPQMSAALSAARPFRLGRTSPRSSSAVSENSSDHRSATRGTAQNAAHLRRSPP